MFTVEIGGRAIAVTNADEAQARELIASEEFQEDLTIIHSEGKPIWDGKSKLEIRPATSDEEEEFESADDLDDEEDSDDEPSVVFLVDIDEDEDEEEAGSHSP
ncbi:MAG: hypothetical protein JWL62_1748 [Hyphomicrobiales bacterium]|nr:hypothetical protein [Hyphomicrobiales bacterium]